MPEWEHGKPTGVTARDPPGEGGPIVFVPDTHYNRVMVYAGEDRTDNKLPGGRLLTKWGEYGRGAGQFIFLTDVAILTTPDGAGITRLYISEYEENDRISIYEPATGVYVMRESLLAMTPDSLCPAVPAVAANASDEKIRCEAVANSGSSGLVALSTSSTTGMPRAAAARQIGSTKSGNRLSTSSTSMSATSAAGVRRRRAVEAPAVHRRHHLLAVAVDEDAGHRDRAAVDAEHARRIDAGLRQRVEEAAARIVGADRAGKARAAAEPRHRDRRIGGAAAGGGDQVAGAHLGARRGKAFDLEQEIFHRDAGAQHHRCALGRVRRSQRRSPPTRG